MMPRSAAPVLLAAAALAACGALSSGDSPRARGGVGSTTLPTGRPLDPAALAACGALSSGDSPRARGGVGSITLPTGRRLDPAGRSMPVGDMPLGAAAAP